VHEGPAAFGHGAARPRNGVGEVVIVDRQADGLRRIEPSVEAEVLPRRRIGGRRRRQFADGAVARRSRLRY